MRHSWEHVKREIVKYARLAFERRLVAGSGGNVSVRTGDGNMLITASGISLAETAPENLITVSLDTLEWRAGKGLLPSREYVYHAQILRLREDINCVMHVHPPYATTFAALHRDIPAEGSAGFRLPEIQRVPLQAGGLAKLQEEIITYVRSYPAAEAFLVEGHGLTTLGASPREAFELADMIEAAAQVAYQAELLGRNPRVQ